MTPPWTQRRGSNGLPTTTSSNVLAQQGEIR
jgi:hypothetical protein